MIRELVERLREYAEYRTTAQQLSNDLWESADLIERQDILIKEMAETLRNMALSLSDEDTEE